VRCREESRALKVEREGKDAGHLVAARLPVEGVQAIVRTGRRLFYL